MTRQFMCIGFLITVQVPDHNEYPRRTLKMEKRKPSTTCRCKRPECLVVTEKPVPGRCKRCKEEGVIKSLGSPHSTRLWARKAASIFSHEWAFKSQATQNATADINTDA